MSGDTNWGQVVGGAVDGALGQWLDSPNDESVSASDAAATSGGNSRPEKTALPNGSGQAQTGNAGWSIPKGNNLLLIGGGVLAFGALVYAVSQ